MIPTDKTDLGSRVLRGDDSLLDLQTLAGLQLLDKDLLPKLIDSFDTDTRIELAQLRDAVARQDNNAIHQSAHSVTGVCGALGAMSLFELCKEVKTAAGEGTEFDFQEKLEHIESIYAQTLEAMQKFLSFSP